MAPARLLPEIPSTQIVAMVTELGGKLHFRDDYPVPEPRENEVLAKVLYTGVCQSGQVAPLTSHVPMLTQIADLHTKAGTAAGPDGNPITAIKLPHIGGHEGIGKIVSIGSNVSDDVRIGGYVGIRFASRICRRCEFCLAGQEQHCVKSSNHVSIFSE